MPGAVGAPGAEGDQAKWAEMTAAAQNMMKEHLNPEKLKVLLTPECALPKKSAETPGKHKPVQLQGDLTDKKPPRPWEHHMTMCIFCASGLPCRGILLTRDCLLLGPYSRPVPRALR
jgi:hypothetical protein